MADIYIDIDYSICDKANRAVLDLLQKKEEKKTETFANTKTLSIFANVMVLSWIKQ
ncbi:hypothetical protein NXV81_18645 [Bacteroides ovatus]|nr:hypothetical protein [Bacteroides ovatus]